MYRWMWITISFLWLVGCDGGPRIARFIASNPRVPMGSTVQLSWDVKGAERVELSGVGVVEGVSIAIRPQETTTFVLTASAAGRPTASAQLTVEVTGGADARIGHYRSGSVDGTVVLVRIRDDQGQPPSVDNTVYVDLPGEGEPLAMPCRAGADGCYATFPEAPPAAGDYFVRFRASDVQHGQSASFDDQPPAPPGVLAERIGSDTVHAHWDDVPGALAYRTWIEDLDAQSVVGEVNVSSSASTTWSLAGVSPDHSLGVFVEAMTFDPAHPVPSLVLTPTWVVRGATYLVPPGAWQLWTPAQFQGDTLQVTFNGFAPDEHLAVIPLNLSPVDHAPVQLAVSNVLAPPTMSIAADEATATAEVVHRQLHSPLAQWEQAARAVLERAQRQLAKPMPRASALESTESSSFCIGEGLDGKSTLRVTHLVHETAHARFFVDDADTASFEPYGTAWWDDLGDAWEARIYPRVTAVFGTESDIDGNQKINIVFSDLLGPAQGNAILVGYFRPIDIAAPADASCSTTGSNGGEFLYVNALGNLLPRTLHGPPPAQVTEVLEHQIPETLAHELQHLIHFNQRYLVYGTNTAVGEETWINEGLSVTAEDIAGYGWYDAAGRNDAAVYLNRAQDGIPRHADASLTLWEGSPIGNYQGSHTFFRFWADQLGEGMLGRIVHTTGVGRGNLERAIGIPFEWALAQWTTGLMFSNESFSPDPRFNFTTPAWTPLHQMLESEDEHGQPTRKGYLRYVPLGPSGVSVTLRTNGFDAFLTGGSESAGQPVMLTVKASGSRPHVVVVRFRGDLPSGGPAVP